MMIGLYCVICMYNVDGDDNNNNSDDNDNNDNNNNMRIGGGCSLGKLKGSLRLHWT